MDIYKLIDLQDCPRCQGPALLEEENGWCLYVMCMDCGCRTAPVPFDTEEEKLSAARAVADLWTMGKVVSSDPGE